MASKIDRFAIPRNDVKFIIDNWYLILIAAASGVMLLPALRVPRVAPCQLRLPCT